MSNDYNIKIYNSIPILFNQVVCGLKLSDATLCINK